MASGSRQSFLPFSPPLIGEEEIAEVVDSLRSGWITTGPKTQIFQDEFRSFIQAPEALALNSGTAAMHTALAALGIGAGDEVITSTMTFCSTIHVIEQVGATPVLVDVQPDTLNIDPECVAAAITTNTRAILPVHFGGHPVDLDPLQKLATRNGLHIVEDAAHAFPAKYKGQWIGSGDNPVAFSFYATKNITTAEGGMLTGSPDLLAKAAEISLHGMNRDSWKRYEKSGSWHYEVVRSGFKYNMSDIQAAIGIWQLRKIETMQERRQFITQTYNAAFKDLDAIELPVTKPDVEPAWHLYPIRLNLDDMKFDRDHFCLEMKSRNIGISVHFIPNHIQPYFRDKYGYRPEDFPIAYKNYFRLVSLPLHPGLSDSDVEDVIAAVRQIFDKG